MTGTPVVADHETTTDRVSGKASLWRVVKDQRKTIYVAVAMSVASYWILGQLGEWLLAGCIVAGVALGLVNHLATEYWLLRIITSCCPWSPSVSPCGSGPTASACCSGSPSSG